METRRQYTRKPTRQVYYLSAEFLMGRALGNNLINTGIKDAVVEVLKDLNIDYNILEDEEGLSSQDLQGEEERDVPG